MFENTKKKLSKKLMKYLLTILPFFLGAVVIATAVGSVVSFFTGLFKGTKNKTGIEVDINSMTLVQLIDASQDPDVITDETLDYMMIERNTLTNLLKEIHLFNESFISKNKKVEYKREYTVSEPLLDENGVPILDSEGNPITVSVRKTDYGWFDYPVSTLEIEGPYKIDWQVVYLAAVFQAFENYDLEDKNTSKLKLSQTEIKKLVDDFKPKFYYKFDVVRDTVMKYTYSQSQQLPNDGIKSNGGSPDTSGGRITWYEPKSLLDTIELSYSDIYFIENGSTNPEVIEYLNMNRWVSIMKKHWPNYDDKWFRQLLRELPGGEEVHNKFMYKFGAEIEQFNPTGSWSHYEASGHYEPLDNVKPSINIPIDAGGMSIPLYTQYDKRWGNIGPVGSGTMSSSGCGLVSLAMVLSYLEGVTIYPGDIYAWCGNRYYVEGQGQAWSLISDAGAHWGYNVKAQAVDADQIVAELSKGRPVIVSTSGYGTSQYFTSAGHYIVLRGLTADGKVLVNDPNDNVYSKTYYAKAYDPEFIESECRANGNLKMMWSFY